MGQNPLRLVTYPQMEEWGRYKYNNLIRINANDQSAADDIAILVKNSYASLVETIEAYKAELENSLEN
jgi:hypothetical protein